MIIDRDIKMTELELITTMQKYKASGVGASVLNAEFAAMINLTSLYERHKRIGELISIISMEKLTRWREQYKLYLCIISIEYEVIE